MEISEQIKNHRMQLQLSQEELAKRIYVSRQTISNWENEKSYPDIHSLLLLSNLFGVPVDELIKGDLKKMKQEINQEEVNAFNTQGNIFSALVIASILTFVPLLVWKGMLGLVLWLPLYLITMLYAFRIEKLKRTNNIHTYKEVVAFSEGKRLDEIETIRESGKQPYQTVIKFLAGAGVGLLLGALVFLLMK
ncbi:transcriptional regulator [Erysipelotrichaceae bacterium NYU-BL-E8]|uniref:Transcriptional regulator n=2 Tax=Ileibacterium valens TaxID=1862668 RepID=A0A1U7NEU5_9FIRM|nr:helix-turn-helix domain-containing protein [Ileibacterium valens]OLU38349.1 transcriptional regulator [Ileibacterium valens]OLU38495.1 transcriptional regulator [Erysipelotrichaceae bacterium NYU-BL-E8]OLU38528.1 transcriptional regulator [Erysipelotrichaceae bacterium NYU-BL-F16]